MSTRRACAESPAVAGRPLLSFEGVVKRARDGERSVALLDGVSFELSRGASAGLFGSPRTGKSTLLRLASGIERAEKGVVRFEGCELASLPAGEHARLLARRIALIVEGTWQPLLGESALDHVVVALGATGISVRDARRRALGALDRAEVAACAAEPAHELSRAQRARVELAAALAREPSLLLVDEPLLTPSPTERERFCALLRDCATELGIALLIASESLSALQGLDCLMSLFGGELTSTARSGDSTVIPLASRRAGSRA